MLFEIGSSTKTLPIMKGCKAHRYGYSPTLVKVNLNSSPFLIRPESNTLPHFDSNVPQ